MEMRGRAWIFGDNINTDQIIPTKYMLLTSIHEMSKYTFSSYRNDFVQSVNQNDIIIAGDNFGCGSAREQAPQVLKELGIKAIIAKSFHTTFFRNAINVGLICFSYDDILKKIKESDILLLDIENSVLINETQKSTICLPPLSKIEKDIADAGGLINYYLNNVSKEKTYE